MNAAAIALGMQAEVVVLDRDIDKLRAADRIYQGHLQTVASNAYEVERAVLDADLVIGAVLVPGAKAPTLVSNELVSRMKSGSVLVDIAVDQGGCFEDTRPTTHDDPTYRVHDSVFYCVANMPGAVPNTSTHALTNVTLPYVMALANEGTTAAVHSNRALAPRRERRRRPGRPARGGRGARDGRRRAGGGSALTASLDAPARDLERVVTGYLDHLTVERGLAANTIASYRRDLRRYVGYLAAAGVRTPGRGRGVRRRRVPGRAASGRRRPPAAVGHVGRARGRRRPRAAPVRPARRAGGRGRRARRCGRRRPPGGCPRRCRWSRWSR